jgi:hypothetical protein
MNVKELTEKLKDVPDDYDVIRADSEFDWGNVSEVEIDNITEAVCLL